MPVPISACSRTSTGGTTGVKPCGSSFDIAHWTSASSSLTSGPLRYTKREPETRAARSVSSQSPSSSTWLRPVLPDSPTSRITSSSAAAVGSARFGSEWIPARRRSSTSSASSRIAGSTPRRASESRAGWGSSRIRLRSSTATPAPALLALAAGRRVVRPAVRLAGVLLDEVRDRLGLGAGHDVGGHDRPGEPAVADREQHVVPVLLAHVEVRAVRALAALELAGGLGAVRVGRLEGVAAGAALVEQLGPAARGLIVLGDLHLTAAAREERGGQGAGDGDRARHGGA